MMQFVALASLLSVQAAKMDWQHDYKNALAKAKVQDKYIVLHFTGSN